MQKTEHLVIQGTIECLSGLRIGGSGDFLQIGGVDSGLSCIRNPVTLAPYIPGSSLKGKMRSELENKLGLAKGNAPCGCGDCPVCRVFGSLRSRVGPARIIVRDSPLISDFQMELKSSTAIDRQTGTAMRGSLRTEERVAAGARFALHIGIQCFDIDTDFTFKGQKGREALFAIVQYGLWLVGKTGLGSGVSKGSGGVRFDFKSTYTNLDNFKYEGSVEADESLSS